MLAARMHSAGQPARVRLVVQECRDLALIHGAGCTCGCRSRLPSHGSLFVRCGRCAMVLRITGAHACSASDSIRQPTVDPGGDGVASQMVCNQVLAPGPPRRARLVSVSWGNRVFQQSRILHETWQDSGEMKAGVHSTTSVVRFFRRVVLVTI